MSSHRSEKGPSQRQLRVGEQLRHIIAETLQRGEFYGEQSFQGAEITITEVQATPDLKNANVYVISHSQQNIDSILEALNSEARQFQQDISKQSNLKFTPRIHFVFDKSFEKSQRIDSLLSNLTYTTHDEDNA